ncbi:endosome-associated-trafficking regulator 1 isoform X1 [Salmo salar]|uniref:Endosome-associated-trafficking regulator 1 n=1 Tax=Salmo salar TaxID=8030 RepID=A0A1S3PIS9_SALSA|nr:endosome-associated-trafficking regulator 1-like isoform X1 [Salmo salar]|eukprot:XP_014027552.1 PREDICTED: serologically defined colon cancer antigen 3 homolog isoform X1 [Salmo salar]
MAKHKTSAKTLIIEHDDVREDGDDMNPFSFKEFIRSKNQGDPDEKKYPTRKEAYGSTFLAEGEYTIPGPKSFDQDFQGHFYVDPAPFPQSLDNETKEWAGSYQPSAIEEVHEFRLCGTAAADSSTYSGQSSLCTEEEEDTSLSVWQVDEEFSPKAPQYRRAPVNYEGDDETSMAELSYKTKKSSTENGHRDQQKLREENTQLRNNIKYLVKKSEKDDQRIRHLTDELHKRRVQEEREAQALETMVHSVEQNLQLMTKRAVKAENIVSKLKEELHQLQGQVEGCRYENERLRARETAALNTMKHNAQVASEYLNKAALNAETSIKQLLTGAETLCLVSQLLQSIDNISEIHNEG